MHALGVALIYTTYPDAETAGKMADTLLTDRLAACVNILPGMTAVYEWQGKLERAAEVACLIKTTRAKAPLVVDRLRTIHPYDNPAILSLETEAASKFETWVAAQTSR